MTVDNVSEVHEVVLRGPRFDDSELRALSSFDDAVRLLQMAGETVVNGADELGNGFAILDSKDKAKLVGTPLLLLSWNFNRGDKGLFVSIQAITRDGRKLIINDGSTGILSQLEQYTSDTQKLAGMYLPHGLRVSEYDYEDPTTGEKSKARTYYLDTTA